MSLPAISAALNAAISEAEAKGKTVAYTGTGLQPAGTRQDIMDTYDVSSTMLHISLVGGEGSRALYLALLHAGFEVPSRVIAADVFLGDGEAHICVQRSGHLSWSATLGVGSRQWELSYGGRPIE